MRPDNEFLNEAEISACFADTKFGDHHDNLDDPNMHFGEVVKVDDESEIAMTAIRTGGVPLEICNVK